MMPAAHAQSLLAVDKISVTYTTGRGTTNAVSEVSFSIARGEKVAIVGESGSGKTATCLAVAGFLTHPDAHVSARSVRFEGHEIDLEHRPRLPERIPGIAMIFQDAMTSLDPVWSVGSQLVAVLRNTRRLSAVDAQAAAREWLTRVGLHETDRVMQSRPGQLSGGMRQRVMIALALAGEPRLVIADEPTSALDAALARSAIELLVQLTSERDVGLVIVSHDIHLCEHYCDRVLVMYGGQLVETGASDVLAEEARHPYTAGLLASVPDLESAMSLERLPTIPESRGDQRFARTGCVFQYRCLRRTDQCVERPDLTVLRDDRQAVACWHPLGTPPPAIEIAGARA